MGEPPDREAQLGVGDGAGRVSGAAGGRRGGHAQQQHRRYGPWTGERGPHGGGDVTRRCDRSLTHPGHPLGVPLAGSGRWAGGECKEWDQV